MQKNFFLHSKIAELRCRENTVLQYYKKFAREMCSINPYVVEMSYMSATVD